jgi:hypothetical protein
MSDRCARKMEDEDRRAWDVRPAGWDDEEQGEEGRPFH